MLCRAWYVRGTLRIGLVGVVVDDLDSVAAFFPELGFERESAPRSRKRTARFLASRARSRASVALAATSTSITGMAICEAHPFGPELRRRPLDVHVTARV